MTKKSKIIIGIIIIFIVALIYILSNQSKGSQQKKIFIQQNEVIQSSQNSNIPT